MARILTMFIFHIYGKKFRFLIEKNITKQNENFLSVTIINSIHNYPDFFFIVRKKKLCG